MEISGTPLGKASIAQIHAAIATGQTTARRLVEAYLERIAEFDQTGLSLNAVVTLNPNALQDAAQLDQRYQATGQPVGPLHGVPMVLKDCLETADMATSFGSEIFANYHSGADATVVSSCAPPVL